MVRRAIYHSKRPADHDYGLQPHPVDLSSSVIIYIFITCNASARSPQSRLMDPALGAQTAPSLQVRLSGCRPPGSATPIRYISPFVLTWNLSLSQSAATGGADIHLDGDDDDLPPSNVPPGGQIIVSAVDLSGDSTGGEERVGESSAPLPRPRRHPGS